MTLALVTGGGGFLGRYIVEKLRESDTAVRVLSRRRYPELERLGCECIQGDIRNSDVVAAACRGVDVVYHVAALAGVWGKRREFFSINVDGTLNVIKGCQVNRVPKLVYTSSPSVVFDMGDLEGVDERQPYPQKYYAHYPESKAIAERLVLNANDGNALATCSLRPHLIWGPRDTHIIPMLISRARCGKLIQVGGGNNKVDVTYVENAAEAHILAGKVLSPHSPVAGQVYFISDRSPVNLWAWVNHLLELLNLPTVKKKLNYRTAYYLGAAMECLYSVVPFLNEPRITRFVASQFAKSHYFNNAKARKHFRYNPTISNEEGLQRTVDYFNQTS